MVKVAPNTNPAIAERTSRKRLQKESTIPKKPKRVTPTCQRPSTSPARKDPFKALISSRERGRQYRERLRKHHKQLHNDVAQLHQHVHDLKMLAALQQKLTKSPPHVANAVLTCVREVLAQQKPRDDEDTARYSVLRLRVATFALIGSISAPVVVLRGNKRGRLPLKLIHRLYFCAPGNSALLDALIDREVTFTTARMLYFGADGSLTRDTDETDYATVLATILGNACGLSEMLPEMERPRGSSYNAEPRVEGDVSSKLPVGS